MRSADDLLAAVSDELSRRVGEAVMSARSTSPELRVLPGFPFTLIRAEEASVDTEAENLEKPAPVIYEIRSNSEGTFVDFFLGNPTTTNGDYPVRLPVDTEVRQFYFLKVVAAVEAACICLDPGPPASWVCVNTDVDTVSVTVERHTSIPEQENPMTSSPCGDPEEGSGWGSFFGSPSGEYTVYLPLLCLDFTGGTQVSYAGGELATIASRNPMYEHLRDTALLGGDSSRLWWSDGGVYSFTDIIQGGDPGALAVAGLYARPFDPEHSPFILQSL